MAKRRREKMSEGKKNIIAGLIQEYDIKTAEDIQKLRENGTNAVLIGETFMRSPDKKAVLAQLRGK